MALTGADVASHSTREDLWMIINGQVYDLTEFAPSHPGGMKILMKFAGKDATEEYEPIHPPGTIESILPKEKHLGPVDMGTVEKVVPVKDVAKVGGSAAPTLAGILSLNDMENAAEKLLKLKAWAYYASAADTERTKIWNSSAYDLIRFRPRVLVDVEQADLSTTILGQNSSLPFFIAPAAMGRLAHPDGEKCLARVAEEFGFPYIVSANASIGFEDLVDKTSATQTLFYQLYVNKDRAKTEAILKKVAKAGYKGICVTVDAPVAGKRERDERSKMDDESASDDSMRAVGSDAKISKAKQGIAQALGAAPSIASLLFSYVDPKLSFVDLAWIRQVSGLPLMVKGVATYEDAALCAQHGVEAIYLSNHGGRQLDGAPSALETLFEIRKYAPQVFKTCEVYLDGGIRRGTDVLKALCLGATAVGIGRPFMYSLIFGDEGVATVATILRDELAQNLRLLGAQKLSDLNPRMLNTRRLEAIVFEDEDKKGFWAKL